MTPGIQRAIRIPPDLFAQITAEAERRGPPWTFSSVAVAAMRAGLAGRSHDGEHDVAVESLPPEAALTQPQPKPSDSRVVSSLTDKDPVYERAPHAESKSPTRLGKGPVKPRPKGGKT